MCKKGVLVSMMIAFTLMLSCASAKKPLSTTAPKQEIKKDEVKKSTPFPSTPASRLSRKESDSLDRIYPVVNKPMYNIAVLLPFYIDRDEINNAEKNTASISRDYYKGILLGLDSLKKAGAKLNVYAIDNARDAAGLNRLKDTLKSLNIDLVIGPLLESELKKIVPFCNANKINIVSPVTTLDTCFDKTYYLESNPGQSTYGKAAAELIKKDFKDQRIILVNERTTATNPISKAFVAEGMGDSLHVIDYRGKGAVSFTGLKGFTEKTVLFLPSQNEIFLSTVMSKVQLLDTMDYDISVVALYPWLNFKSLEGSIWDKYNFHLLVPFNIDYTNREVKSFVEKFRSKYNEEPNEYGFRGFDDIVFYSSMLFKYGTYFQRSFTNENVQELHASYHFERTDNCSGYKNTGLHIIKFEDYEFKKVR